MERMVTKQDVSILNDTIKGLIALEQQSQQMLKQAEYNRSQLSRRVVSLETRIANFENEIRVLTATVTRSSEQQRQPLQVAAPAQNQPEQPAPVQPVTAQNYYATN